MRPVRLAIWIATGFSVVMLFLPLVRDPRTVTRPAVESRA